MSFAARSSCVDTSGDGTESDETTRSRDIDKALAVLMAAESAADAVSPSVSALARGDLVARDSESITSLLKLRDALVTLHSQRLLPAGICAVEEFAKAVELEGGTMVRLISAARGAPNDAVTPGELEAELHALLTDARHWPQRLQIATMRLVFSDAVGRDPTWAAQLCSACQALEEKVKELSEQVAELRRASVHNGGELSGGLPGRFVI
jgi:hypothetical protein